MISLPKLSVILPTLNRESFLVDTITQVLNDKFKDLELIVVDQSDKHDRPTADFLESVKDPRFHYYLVQPKSGVAAKNFGLGAAQAPISVFLDDDVTLDPECLTAHYESYSKHPDIGGVAGRVEQEGHERATELLYFDRYGIPHGRFNYLQGEYTNTMPGGNMSVKTNEAIAVGGFSTNFLRSQHREESEFSERFYRAGNKIYFEPNAMLTHLAAPYGGTRIKIDFADSLDYYKHNLYFTLKYCKPWVLPLALLVQLRFYSLRRNPITTLRRTLLFGIGLITAIKRLILPIRITSVVIRELP